MKIEKTKNKRLIIGALCAFLVIAGLASFYILNGLKDSHTNEEQPGPPDRSTTDIQQSKDLAENPENKKTPNNTDTPAPVTADNESGKATVQMVASVDTSNNTVYIRGGINNSVEYDGTCFVELISPNGEIIKKETTLLQNSATTDCKTISIPFNELSPGQWKYTLNYSSNTKTGKTDEDSFNI